MWPPLGKRSSRVAKPDGGVPPEGSGHSGGVAAEMIVVGRGQADDAPEGVPILRPY